MSFHTKFARVLAATALIALFSVFAFADVIKLKDGSTIKGKILSFTNGQFIILIGSGERQRQMRFFADEIESIEFDSKPVPMNASNNTSENSPPNYTTQTKGDSTIITVGSKTPNPQSNTTVVKSAPPTEKVSSNTNAIKPIQIRVKVLADNTANGWTNAGWVVRKGQRIRINGSGRISLGNGRYSGPKGISTLPDANKLIGDKPTGSLIAVIGDDNNDFIHIGDSIEFVAERDGALFLGVNEGVLDDNTGSFEVTVEIDPRIGS
ncbi:MAG: hypothetical protein HKN33_09025 [Pyrinomonadaceae bacterium]|nr:hypothetical protein [Pyrinomonadaceae bacterium]